MRGRTTRRRSRTRGALLALVLLCTGAAPLTGCSSGSEEADRTSGTDTSGTDTSPDPTDATTTGGTTGGGDTDEDARERRRQEKDSGSFSRAGRLSDDFDGFFPEIYEKFVENPSSEPYVGTVTAVDCSPDGNPQPMAPSSQTVTVPPNTEGNVFRVSFDFPQGQGDVTSNTSRIICVTLRDEGGVRGEDKDPLSVQLSPTGEETGETTTGETTTGETTTGETTTGETTTGETTTGETTTGETTTGETTTGETTTGETTTGETTDGGTGESGESGDSGGLD
ncbi:MULTISPECIES: hypothetical protein [Streptomyces]|uniref:Lipoprotein n=2 Tax=Streptomyces TaxID=1883 RepID=A0ABU4KJ68_9ACTN|nr:hypothetical protein [Streptomyces roseolus]MDX2297849.1 hypothetical protein [Streptomyces roseolus]